MKKVITIISLSFLLVLVCVLTACGGGGADIKGTYRLNYTPTQGGSSVEYTIEIGDDTVSISYNNTKETVTYRGTYTSNKNDVTVKYTVDNVEKEVVFTVDPKNNTITLKSGNLVYVIGVTTYTVTFMNGTTELKKDTVVAGQNAIAPANPTKDGHTFTGWDKEFTNVTSNLVVNAVFTPNVVNYTVTFKSDGAVIGTPQSVASGTAATAPANPTKTGYRFDKWDVAFNNITADTVVNAVFVKVFTVTFKADETTIGTPQIIDTGKSATAPANPTKTGYLFLGWDKEFDNITADTVVNANFVIDENLIYVTETKTGDTVVVEIAIKGSLIRLNVFDATLNYTGLTFVGEETTFLTEFNNVAEQHKCRLIWTLTSGNQTEEIVVVEITFTASAEYSYTLNIDDIGYVDANGIDKVKADTQYTVID